MRATGAGAVLVCLLLALAGCGSDLDKAGDRSPAPAAQQPGSAPDRLALEWWRALQDRDPATVIGLLTPPARDALNAERTSARIRGSFGRWAEATTVDLLYSERGAKGVTVYMRIEAGELIGPVLSRRGTVMLALPFVSRLGEWKIDNSAWLRLQVELWTAADRFRRAQKAEAEGP
jgi:hypothetical protein